VSYRLSEGAEADLLEIWDYSAEQWSVEQADRYIDALVSRFAWLSANRALWHPRTDLGEGLHSYPQQSHVIYFRPRGERPVLKMLYAAAIRASDSCKGIRIGELERRQLERLQTQLNQHAKEESASAVNMTSTPQRIYSTERT